MLEGGLKVELGLWWKVSLSSVVVARDPGLRVKLGLCRSESPPSETAVLVVAVVVMLVGLDMWGTSGLLP